MRQTSSCFYPLDKRITSLPDSCVETKDRVQTRKITDVTPRNQISDLVLVGSTKIVDVLLWVGDETLKTTWLYFHPVPLDLKMLRDGHKDFRRPDPTFVDSRVKTRGRSTEVDTRTPKEDGFRGRGEKSYPSKGRESWEGLSTNGVDLGVVVGGGYLDRVKVI